MMHTTHPKRLLVAAMAVASPCAASTAQDSLNCPRLTGYFMTEVNYGHRHGQPHPTVTDFPHLVAGGQWQLGKGWSVVAEAEYERFRIDGLWSNKFRGNYTTNKLYVNKKWSEALNIKAGIIDLPVGTTNSGGPALTIYDPLDESTLMPMTWHEGGAAFWGRQGLWHYEAGLYCYAAVPFKRSRLLGTAVRLGMQPANGLDVSLSYFYGSSREGMVQRQNPNLAHYSHFYHAALDFSYVAHGWTVDGQLLASKANRDKAAGIEAGYNLCHGTSLASVSVTPFVRYDGFFHVEGVSCSKATAGLNTTLPLGFVVKLEWGWTNPSNSNHIASTDASVGWQCEF